MLPLLVGIALASTPTEFEALIRQEAGRLAAGAPDDLALSASLESALASREALGRDEALMRFSARLVAIGDREPVRAMRWIPKLPQQGNDIPRRRATEYLFRRWVRRDARAAADAALQFWRDGLGHPVGDLLHEWVQFAPAGAIEWVRALDDKERTQLAAYEQLLGALPSVDHRAALGLAETVPERYHSALIGAYSQILPRLVSADVDAALAAYQRFEARSPEAAKQCVGSLVRAWAERQPEKALVFAEGRLAPEDPRRYAALQAIATAWAKTNPRAAADLSLRAVREQRRHRAFEDHRHGPKQDPLADIVLGWAVRNRRAARIWVEAIEEADLREHLLHALGVPPPKPLPPPRQGSRHLGAASSPTELKYGLIGYYGRIFYCDVDLYPVHDAADEQRRAVENFPAITADRAHYAAILKHLAEGAAAEPGPELKLKVYREHKKLGAVKLEATKDGYSYELLVDNARVMGRIVRALITETKRTPQITECPVCLTETTRVDTPRGAVPVTELRVGTWVWTLDETGARVAAPVLGVASTPAPPGHVVVRLLLGDGRTVSASPNHPLADGRPLRAVRVGEAVDGATVVRVELLPYRGAATYDLLPAGGTGVYWADGVPLATTLDRSAVLASEPR